MKINFLSKENEIKTYIETHLPAYIQNAGLKAIDLFIDDFLDFEKYKANTQLFYNFSNYSFDNLSNESNSTAFTMSLYFALKGDTAINLRESLLKYASCFYEMFADGGDNLEGIFDFGMINEIAFYNAAEGHKELKVCEISLTFNSEV